MSSAHDSSTSYIYVGPSRERNLMANFLYVWAGMRNQSISRGLEGSGTFEYLRNFCFERVVARTISFRVHAAHSNKKSRRDVDDAIVAWRD
jgi:hypothetical protein